MDAMQAHDDPSLEVEVRVQNVTVRTNITSICWRTDEWFAVSPYRTNRAGRLRRRHARLNYYRHLDGAAKLRSATIPVRAARR